MKLSKHSKERMRERTNYNHKQRTVLFGKALKYGDWHHIKNEDLKNFLQSKETWRSQVKLFKGYVFIHSKNSKRLYTMYELPEKYKEIYKEEK